MLDNSYYFGVIIGLLLALVVMFGVFVIIYFDNREKNKLHKKDFDEKCKDSK